MQIHWYCPSNPISKLPFNSLTNRSNIVIPSFFNNPLEFHILTWNLTQFHVIHSLSYLRYRHCSFIQLSWHWHPPIANYIYIFLPWHLHDWVPAQNTALHTLTLSCNILPITFVTLSSLLAHPSSLTVPLSKTYFYFPPNHHKIALPIASLSYFSQPHYFCIVPRNYMNHLLLVLYPWLHTWLYVYQCRSCFCISRASLCPLYSTSPERYRN